MKLSVPIERTPRVVQMEGIFDVPPSERSHVEIPDKLELPGDDWSVGLIVGPSGCGKSTLARKHFGDDLVEGFDWPESRSVLDGFPADLGIKDITELLNSVGFCSPPAWLRPFHVLSNGEQFRVTIARALSERRAITVMDEFTSVVDRTVAQIGSATVAKMVRKRKQRFVAVSCHYDIEAWLKPDWTYEPHLGKTHRRSVQRPRLTFRLHRVSHKAWHIFAHHHYLTAELSKSAACFMLTLEGGGPVAFYAILSFPHAHRPGWRFSRIVVLPDYQGLGLGIIGTERVCGMYRATGKPVFLVASHPAVIRALAKSPHWTMRRKPGIVSKPGKTSTIYTKQLVKRAGDSGRRITAGFEYIGPVYADDARAFGVVRPGIARRGTREESRRPRLGGSRRLVIR